VHRTENICRYFFWR